MQYALEEASGQKTQSWCKNYNYSALICAGGFEIITRKDYKKEVLGHVND
jgi:hypothetical protein